MKQIDQYLGQVTQWRVQRGEVAWVTTTPLLKKKSAVVIYLVVPSYMSTRPPLRSSFSALRCSELYLDLVYTLQWVNRNWQA